MELSFYAVGSASNSKENVYLKIKLTEETIIVQSASQQNVENYINCYSNSKI